jgi:hypothetical protein
MPNLVYKENCMLNAQDFSLKFCNALKTGLGEFGMVTSNYPI